MDSCLSVVSVIVVSLACLTALILILLALPKSRLRFFLFEFFGWGTAGLSTLLIVSPIDLLPFIPLEDPLYLITALGGAATAYFSNKGRKELDS